MPTSCVAQRGGDNAPLLPHTRVQLLKSIFNNAKVVLVVKNDRFLRHLKNKALIDHLASEQAASKEHNV